MLFENKAFASKFDIERKVSDEDTSISALANEIYRITMKLYDHEHTVVSFHHCALQSTPVFVDYANISEHTWYRTPAEIKEILYRPLHQKQFSINKALTQLHIHEPGDTEAYKRYLQLLYVVYMINYFAFPKVNMFLLLKQQMDYTASYDGTQRGIYLSFLMANLLEGDELYTFIYKQQEISVLLEQVSHKLAAEIPPDLDDIIAQYRYIQVPPSNNPIQDAIDVFQNIAMLVYTTDLSHNLTTEHFTFDPLVVPPFSYWKRRYIPLDALDTFLYEDDCYQFCKQTKKKVEVRDKIKFNQSNAIIFLKKLIDYDIEWMNDHEEEEGLLIEIHEGKPMIYALRIAVIIKTYDDLINKMQVRITSKNTKFITPLRTLLSAKWSIHDVFPPTLAIRYFLLAAHAQFLHAIDRPDHDTYFKQQYLDREIANMKVFQAAYQLPTYEQSKHFLIAFLQH